MKKRPKKTKKGFGTRKRDKSFFVWAFDRFMEGIDLNKYLKSFPEYITGRNRYNPVDMLKTVLTESIEAIFQDINLAIFSQENVDLSHIYIDGTKLEANASKYSWVWKKATENPYRAENFHIDPASCAVLTERHSIFAIERT